MEFLAGWDFEQNMDKKLSSLFNDTALSATVLRKRSSTVPMKRSRSLSNVSGAQEKQLKSLAHSQTHMLLDTSSDMVASDQVDHDDVFMGDATDPGLQLKSNVLSLPDVQNLTPTNLSVRKDNLSVTSPTDHSLHLTTPTSRSSKSTTPGSASNGATFDLSPNENQHRAKRRNSAASKHLSSTSFKNRSAEFKRLFKADDSEKFLIDYSCAYQREILVHGRLYVSQQRMCFYANLFKWETNINITFEDVDIIQKKRTAKVIPNAIEVTTKNGEKLFFTSFTSRDKAFTILTKISERCLAGQPVQPEEIPRWLQNDFEDNYDSGSCDEQRISRHLHVHEDLNTTRNASRNLEVGDSDKGKDASNERPRSSSLLLNVPAVCRDTDNENSDISEDYDDETRRCPCEEHFGKEIVNEVFPVSVDQMFLLLFTDCPFYRRLHEKRKATNLIVNDWVPDDIEGRKFRKNSYTASLNYSMGPKTCEVIETQVMKLLHSFFYFLAIQSQICSETSKPGDLYVVKCECHQMGIPYGDTFDISTTYCIVRLSTNRCRLICHGGTIYRKSCWGFVKSLIEKSSQSGLTDWFKDVVANLRTECSTYSDSSKSKTTVLPQKRPIAQKASTVRKKIVGKISTKELSQPKLIDVPPVTNADNRLSALENPTFETLTKSVLLILILLLILNSALFYKLWYLEAEAERQSFDRTLRNLQTVIETPDIVPREWMTKLLSQEENRRWRDSRKFVEGLLDTLSAVAIIEKSLQELRRQMVVIERDFRKSRSEPSN